MKKEAIENNFFGFQDLLIGRYMKKTMKNLRKS